MADGAVPLAPRGFGGSSVVSQTRPRYVDVHGIPANGHGAGVPVSALSHGFKLVQDHEGVKQNTGQLFYDPMFPPDRPTRWERVGKGADQVVSGPVQFWKTVQDAATGGHTYEDYTAQKQRDYAHYDAMRDPIHPHSFDGYAMLGEVGALAPAALMTRGLAAPAGTMNAAGQVVSKYPLLSAQGGRVLAQGGGGRRAVEHDPVC